MAQTGYTPILIYASGTTGNTPSAANMTSSASGAELALNYFDGKLFYKDASGVVQVLAGKGGTGVVAGSNTQVQFNNNGVFGAAAGLTWDGTYLTANSIKNSALTSGRVTFAGASGLMSDAAGLTWDGTNFTANSIKDSALTSGRVTYAGTSGLLQDSANLTFDGTKLTVAGLKDSALTSGRVPYATTSGELIDSANLLYSGTDLTVYGITVGRGAGAVSTNTAVGASALAANTTGTGNSAFGLNTLNVTTTGNYNTAIGRSVLYSNTTASSNTAVGYVAMYWNTTGQFNSAVGDNALVNNTTGSYNSALGKDALQANTTASNNTAVGYQAGYSNTTGTANTALGRWALYSNTTANNNTAVGYQAGYSGTTATGVVAIGHTALRANTANFNAAVGFEALLSNTTGTGNTALGTDAVYLNTTGSSNTGLGWGALAANTTASNNTAVGYQAGYTNATGTSNTFLGHQAGNASTGNGNTLVGTWAGKQTTGTYNTFIGTGSTGYGVGELITTGSKNTIIGGYNGNQGGLDIRTASNYIVLSDGDGNPRIIVDGGGFGGIGVVPANQYAAGGGAAWQIGGATNIWNYAVAGNYQTRIYNNAYLDTSAGERYLNTGSASMVQMADGRFFVKSVGSGSAGASASFTTVLDVKVGETLALQGATSQTGTGITFPATQNASSNANTLDDYEEGTWTPTVVGTTTAGTGTYTVQQGTYVKVGRLVFVSIRLGWSNHTGTGNMRINNLPFTNETGNYSALTVAFNDGLTLPANSIFNVQVMPNTTTLLLASLAVAGTTSALAMDTSVTDMAFSGCYVSSS